MVILPMGTGRVGLRGSFNGCSPLNLRYYYFSKYLNPSCFSSIRQAASKEKIDKLMGNRSIGRELLMGRLSLLP
jgi:hypothetical protein